METFVAVRLMSDSWRWAGVPIVIRVGKTMPVTATEVNVRFHHPPRDIFGSATAPHRNELRFRVWPETAVTLTGGQEAGRRPGAADRRADLRPATRGRHAPLRPADRRRAGRGSVLFARQDTVEAAWKVVDPILGDVVPVHPYARGSWGPNEADGCSPTGTPGTTRPADRTRQSKTTGSGTRHERPTWLAAAW